MSDHDDALVVAETWLAANKLPAKHARYLKNVILLQRADAEEGARADERAKIVAWLQAGPTDDWEMDSAAHYLGLAIARGEHEAK